MPITASRRSLGAAGGKFAIAAGTKLNATKEEIVTATASTKPNS
jgi:hypothetical protein